MMQYSSAQLWSVLECCWIARLAFNVISSDATLRTRVGPEDSRSPLLQTGQPYRTVDDFAYGAVICLACQQAHDCMSTGYNKHHGVSEVTEASRITLSK